MNTDTIVNFMPTRNTDNRIQRATVDHIDDNGFIVVQSVSGEFWKCDCLDVANTTEGGLAPGCSVLILPPDQNQPGVVLGRIERFNHNAVKPHVSIEASESLILKCGDASVELRADGKAMVKGDDVLIRAKGTQRIRAGTVSIN
jgi:hypothetical protein